MKRKNKITCGRVLIYFITENWEFEWKSFNSTRFLNQWTCGVVCFDRAVTKLRSCKLDEMPGRCQLPSLTNPPLTVPPPSQPPLFLPLHLPSVHTTVTSVLSKPPTAHPAFHSICWPIICAHVPATSNGAVWHTEAESTTPQHWHMAYISRNTNHQFILNLF